jgi:uncharacterized protein (DUF2384 family)
MPVMVQSAAKVRTVRDTRRKPVRLAQNVGVELAALKAYAVDVLGGAAPADQWLNEPNPALGGRVPWELSREADGRRAVEIVLSRIEHGDYS